MRKGHASPAVVRLLGRAGVRSTLGPRLPVRMQRRILDSQAEVAAKLTVLPVGLSRSMGSLGGRPALRVTPPGADTARAVLYLHGGGYSTGSVRTHGGLVSHLAEAAGARVYLLDYRLAPEHPFPAALDDAAAAYEALLATGLRPDHVAIAGDSAGGGLAVALAMRVRDSGGRLPAALALFSPWVDVTLANVGNDRHDPLLRRSWLARCARAYAGADTANPYVSPIRGDVRGLPPMLIHAASTEILLHDIKRFVERATAAGAAVTYRELGRSWHVAHLHAGLMTTATAAVAEAGHFLRGLSARPDAEPTTGATTS